jgi:hypothetical protein
MLDLYLDEDSMDQALVRALRSRGIDVLTAREAGMIERSDSDHLEYATARGRVLCTSNIAHFCALHEQGLREGRSHAGLVMIPQQRYPLGELLRRLHHICAALSQQDITDRVEFLNAGSSLQ